MSFNSIKAKAKKAIQMWARMRDADENGVVRCCCCGKWINWKHADGAHYIPATYLSTCFVEININATCRYCNRFLEGNRISYMDYMTKKYGYDAVDELERRKNLRVKYAAFELEGIAKLYTEKQKEFAWKNL